MEADVAYFSRRAFEERVRALQAPDPRARRAHLELAARYQDFSAAIAARERFLGLDLYAA
jgi:hypothetical protein